VPELPEVETVVRSIRPHIEGKTILRVELHSRRVTRNGFAEAETGLTGATIQRVRRQGKQIFCDLDPGILYIHLGMTGKLLWNAPPGKYTRALLEFDSGALLFDDVRQFGRFEFLAEAPEHEKGPDALTVDFATFYERLRKHRGSIKGVLLRQDFIAGVGNIYADEALFAARIHPRAKVSRISKTRAAELHRHVLEILQLAVDQRGSSISDYVDSAGNAGQFQLMHRAYGRTGEACVVCGGPIRRVVVAQRGTHYCPHCQRA
jgi:formamidopyrimidine-DNA glycosylase